MEKMIIVEDGREERRITCKESESILEAMQRQGVYLSAFCGGRGTCKKCRIQLVSGEIPVTDTERKGLGEAQIKEGVRLACQAYPKTDCRIRLQGQKDAAFQVVGEEKSRSRQKESGYVIAADIGTTTLAMTLAGKDTGNCYESYTGINHQRAYGADVISRIQASNQGKKEELQACIRRDLLEGIKALVKESGLEKSQVEGVYLSGNTTMGHLLLGFSCQHLGIYPFQPVDIGRITKSFSEVFGEEFLSCPVTLLPGISTYVGGDILAGLLSCGFGQKEETALLVDLGTNGEMALGNRKKILTASTAAGPAFEGGNISWGMGSVQGAICQVEIRPSGTEIKTIGDRPPRGLCGTGVIETAAELVKAGLADETGKLSEEIFQEGFVLGKNPEGRDIVFTQKDMREIQLAKAAVRAGIETLLLRYGISYEQVTKVYLAGGFGFHMDLEKAMGIGLLPEAFQGRVQAVGNSSLAGAVKYALSQEAKEEAQRILEASKEVELSADPQFNEFYMEHMFFEENI